MADDPNIPPKKSGGLRDVVQAESILQLVLAIPAACFVGLGIGYLLDRHFHTGWMAVTLMLLGAGGLAVLYLVVVRMLSAGNPAVSWFLLGAIGVYALTLAPVTWVLISEVFPGKVRGAATSVAVLSLWAAYFVLVFTFPILFDRLGDATFYIYSAVCALGLVFVGWKVKETRGKTLEEIEDAIVRH